MVRKQAVGGEKAVDGCGHRTWKGCLGCALAVKLGPSVLMAPTLSEKAKAQAQSSQPARCLNWLLQAGGPGKLAESL